MSQHVNPGLDTTINPIVIDDSYRSKKVNKNTTQSEQWYLVSEKQLNGLPDTILLKFFKRDVRSRPTTYREAQP